MPHDQVSAGFSNYNAGSSDLDPLYKEAGLGVPGESLSTGGPAFTSAQDDYLALDASSLAVRPRRRGINFSLTPPVLGVLIVLVVALVAAPTWLLVAPRVTQETPETVAQRFFEGWQENNLEKMEGTLHKDMRNSLQGFITEGVLKVVHSSCLQTHNQKYKTSLTSEHEAEVRVITLLECSPSVDLPWGDMQAQLKLTKPFGITLRMLNEDNRWYISDISPDLNPPSSEYDSLDGL